MKHTLPGIIGAAMIVLAGCSSKSAVSTGDQTGAAGAGSTTMTTTAPVSGPVLGDIFFDFDSSALNAESQEQLKQNATWMQNNASHSVTIEGHCDERGTDEYNIALGERRANSAKEYLQTLGISASRLSTVSYGEERPFDPSHNEEAWAKNRRDHFVNK
ncbi:MAG: peptidoglycan-associated lipoprotein Pal [Chlorobiales bacterium]|nr:peptidoglycan-associated lipoprotein Pal [Chlorobiales bacterium]